MMREVYVMDHGVDIFHYGDADDSDFVLTSGFFGALQTFSKEVRSSDIDFFSSSEEIFMFDSFAERENTNIVIVFDNNIQQSVAREILKQVKRIVENSVLFELPLSVTLSRNEEKELRDKIFNVANSLLSIKFQVAAAEDIVKDYSEITHLLIYDYYKDEIHFNYNDNKSIDEEEELLTLRNLQRYSIPLIKQCEVGQNFDLIVLDSFNYILVIFKYRTNFTLILAEDQFRRSEILDVPFKIMSLPEFSEFEKKFQSMLSSAKWIIDKQDRITIDTGNSLLYNSHKKVLKTLETFNRLSKALNLELYHEINIYPEPEVQGYIRITRNYTRGQRFFEIYT